MSDLSDVQDQVKVLPQDYKCIPTIPVSVLQGRANIGRNAQERQLALLVQPF